MASASIPHPCIPHALSGLFLLHRAAGVVFSEMRSGDLVSAGFRAEIIGYRFHPGWRPDPDLAMVATDPRIMALADGLRERDGEDCLTDSALRLVESSASVRTLRRAMSPGLAFRTNDDDGLSWPMS